MNTLTNSEIELILQNIDDSPQGNVLREYVIDNKDKSLLELIRSHKKIINFLPDEIFDMYQDVFIENRQMLFMYCNFFNWKVVAKMFTIIQSSGITGRPIFGEANVDKILVKVDNPMALYNALGGYVSPGVMMSDCTESLPEEFIIKNIVYFSPTFFLHQTLTNNIYKALIKLSKKSSWVKPYIENGINQAMLGHKIAPKLEDGLFEILYPIMNKVAALTLYKLNPTQIDWVISGGKKSVGFFSKKPAPCVLNEEEIKAIIQNQDISQQQLAKMNCKDNLYLYLAHNPYVSDDTFVDMFKEHSDINWSYIIRYVNLCKLPKFTKRLMDNGKETLIRVNVELALQKGWDIDITYLCSIGLDIDFINSSTISSKLGLESTMHI